MRVGWKPPKRGQLLRTPAALLQAPQPPFVSWPSSYPGHGDGASPTPTYDSPMVGRSSRAVKSSGDAGALSGQGWPSAQHATSPAPPLPLHLVEGAGASMTRSSSPTAAMPPEPAWESIPSSPRPRPNRSTSGRSSTFQCDRERLAYLAAGDTDPSIGPNYLAAGETFGSPGPACGPCRPAQLQTLGRLRRLASGECYSLATQVDSGRCDDPLNPPPPASSQPAAPAQGGAPGRALTRHRQTCWSEATGPFGAAGTRSPRDREMRRPLRTRAHRHRG